MSFLNWFCHITQPGERLTNSFLLFDCCIFYFLRSLFERLEEQRAKKEEDWEEEHKFKNQFRKLHIQSQIKNNILILDEFSCFRMVQNMVCQETRQRPNKANLRRELLIKAIKASFYKEPSKDGLSSDIKIYRLIDWLVTVFDNLH